MIRGQMIAKMGLRKEIHYKMILFSKFPSFLQMNPFKKKQTYSQSEEKLKYQIIPLNILLGTYISYSGPRVKSLEFSIL